ncbi:MAG: hypothetical protein Edafosvirus4_12 [Edafosvirus sp.]|uniref:Uncharacterized protein n=1 Tax=Edafosvirus sp. TaxID=2487765 RepID=A0A3G4ZT13_9VIRU|nr:MAG: hypothetical protein Edafosvirus4_12 [Edafosvirus sp.]
MIRSEKTLKFIQDAKSKYGDHFNYDKVVYGNNNKDKVIIICPKNHKFRQSPNNHLKKDKNDDGIIKKCPDCYNISKKYTQKEFLAKAKKEFPGLFDYSKAKYTGRKNKIIIICKKHDEEFECVVDSFLQGQSCWSCALESISHSEEKWLELAKNKHGDRFIYDKSKYTSYTSDIKIQCQEADHGEFITTPAQHVHNLNGGCDKCSKLKYTTEEWIQGAIEIHGDKYNYDKTIYDGVKNKLVVTCIKHNKDCNVRPYIHLRDIGGCSLCLTDTLRAKFGHTNEEFISKAIELYGNKFDYSKVKYINMFTKIIIRCIEHNYEFLRNPHEHLRRHGCKICMMCPKCGLFRTQGKYCGYCEPNSKLFYKTEEMRVVKFLKDSLPDNEFIHNKSVGKDCTEGNLFPDILFDCGFYNLIVEVDENQHRGASYKCDEQRMHDIIAKVMIPCIFIRYNPKDKKKNLKILLKKIKEYLAIEQDLYNDSKEDGDEYYMFRENVWDDFGFKVEYLFYD